METKKESNAQLQKRIRRAIVHVDKTKDTKDIFFSDRGLRLTVNEDYAIVGTGFHRHVFDKFTSSGVSKPYVYTDMVIDLANANDCVVDDGKGNKSYSFGKLMQTLKEDSEKQTEYLIVHYYSMWLFNVFSPLYSIGESEATTFITYIDYVFNIARNAIVLREHTEDLTNKQFIENLCENIKEFTNNINERVIFHKLTDDEFAQQEMEAMQEQENEEVIIKKIEQEENERKDKETE